MPLENFTLVFSCIALLVSVIASVYAVRAGRQTKKIRDELQELHRIGPDAWVEKQLSLHQEGKMVSKPVRFEDGHEYEAIEPLPGWRIQVRPNQSAPAPFE